MNLFSFYFDLDLDPIIYFDAKWTDRHTDTPDMISITQNFRDVCQLL